MIRSAPNFVRKPIRPIKLWWLATAFLSGIALAMWAEALHQRAENNRLHFSAPNLHFLTGRPLERLRNAAPVPFDIQVILWSGTRGSVFRMNTVRFVISYDLWEERFKVDKVALQPQSPALNKSVRNLTAVEAEAWCLEEMAMDMTGVNTSQPLWTRMEIRAVDERESRLFSRDNVSDTGISLTSIIERFSRPPQNAQPHWTLDAGPITWDQLRRGG